MANRICVICDQEITDGESRVFTTNPFGTAHRKCRDNQESRSKKISKILIDHANSLDGH